MPSNDPQERLAALRAWLDLLARDPARGMENRNEMVELAGELFDEDHLDGAQYSAFYDLKRADEGKIADLAKRCRRQIG